MIKRFLKGLPQALTELMFGEYEAKCAELRRWSEKSQSSRYKQYLSHRETIELIFAIGIYYRYVVAPISGAAEFSERIRDRSQAGLEIAGYNFGKDRQNAIEEAHGVFVRIAERHGVPERLLAETEVRRIVRLLIELEERRSDEQP